MFIAVTDNDEDFFMINSGKLLLITCTNQNNPDEVAVHFQMVDGKSLSLIMCEEEWSHVQDQVNKL